MIAKVLDEWTCNEYNLDDLYQSLMEGKAQLWILSDDEGNIHFVGITRILQYPQVKRLLIDLLVGEKIENALKLIAEVEAWAKTEGTTQTEAYARPGLARVLQKKAAFKEMRVVLVREQHAGLPETQRDLG